MPTVIEFSDAVKKKAFCSECGAINEYVPNDVRILSQGRDISGTHCRTEGFNCANCNEEIVTLLGLKNER